MAISATAPSPFKKRQRSPVKPKSGTPPGSPMRGNQSPLMRSQETMGGPTPNMVPPARNTSFMADGRRGQPQYGMPPGSPPVQMIPGNRAGGIPQGGLPPGSPGRQSIGPGGVRGQAQGTRPAGSPPITRLADGQQPLANRRMFHDGRMPHMADGGSIGDVSPIDSTQPDITPTGGDNDQDDTQGQGGTTVVISPESVNYHDDARSCGTCQYFGGGGQCQVLQMAVSEQGGCNAFSGKSQGGEEDQALGAQPGEDNGDNYAGTTPSFGS